MDAGRQCVILVGGRGTRLGALTRDLPKPMIDVSGKPFIEYLLHEVGRHGFRRIVLLAGYQSQLFNRFPRHYRPAPDIDLEISHVVEPELAGTAGALTYAAEILDDEFLLINGDSLFDINFLDLACRPVAGAWTGKIALRRVPDASRYGAVTVEGARITGFAERPERSGPGLINGGVYWLKREILTSIGRTPCSIERDVFPVLAGRGALAGLPYSGFFIDIGVPEDLAQAQHLLPAQSRRAAAFLDRDGVLNIDDGYVHDPSKFCWMEGAKDAVKFLNDQGLFVFVVTNQSGVARGFYSEAHVQRLHQWINAELSQAGAHIDAFRYCPYHEDGVGRYRRESDWRKPEPGMFRDLMTHWPVRTDQSFVIGDNATDLEAARRAGLAGHLFAGGNLRQFVERIVK